MNPRLEAAWEIHQFLAKHRLPYAVIGGLAVQKWSEPRFTRDVDLTVASPLTTGSAIRQWLNELSDALADPEIVERFEQAWRNR